MELNNFLHNYLNRLDSSLKHIDSAILSEFLDDLSSIWFHRNTLFICGNGGSAGNAIHLANDFTYGVGYSKTDPVPGLSVEALPSNSAVITCLANDISYSSIFSQQLLAKANKNDILLCLSGSGNSPNIVSAIETANQIGMKTYSIVAFDGGKCKELSNKCFHIPTEDMQIAEDSQLVIGHLCMQWLNINKNSLS